MKTTQQLIELQRSITQGKWRANIGSHVTMPLIETDSSPINHTRLAIVCSSSPDIEKHNATAIALVPELLAEVIRLREKLEESTALNENFASVSDPETLCHLSEYRAVIKQCRALLADAK